MSTSSVNSRPASPGTETLQSWKRRRLGAVLSLTLIAACSAEVTVGADTTSGNGSADAAADYCVETGGTVETRTPYWNTNGDQSTWVELPGSMDLCWYQTLDDEDQSRIYVDLTTIYAEEPTLAAAAYLAQIPLGRTAGNPAEASCHQNLNGSAWFGSAGASGGGWVNLEDEIFTVVQLCMFPDGSAIDAWGIAYYSDGVARGIDLTEVFRFDQADVPDIFPE